MGRHVNYADEQDRWLNKAEKLNRNKGKKQRLEDKDPNNLTLAEQLELERRRVKAAKLAKEKQVTEPKKQDVWISHYRPK
jgi:hypothetical protein